MTLTRAALVGSNASALAGNGGSVTWTGTANAFVSDDGYVTAALTGAGVLSIWLKVVAFKQAGQSFGVPPGAAVMGIEVQIERHASAGQIGDDTVHLFVGGVVQTAVNKARPDFWPTTDQVAVYGGPTDTWGLGLQVSDLDGSTGFGVVIAATKNDAGAGNALVDAVTMTVYYRTPAGLTTVTLRSGRDPHPARIQVYPAGLRYGWQVKAMSTASFMIPRSHPQLSEIYDLIWEDPTNPPMVTIERADGFLPWVGFITDIPPARRTDPMIAVHCADHTSRLQDAIVPLSGDRSGASGDLLAATFGEADDRAQPVLDFSMRKLSGGPPAQYQYRGNTCEAMLRDIEGQTGWELGYVYEISNEGVSTLATWQDRLGRDQRGGEVWVEDVHLVDNSYGLNFRRAPSHVVVVGGSGTFANRPAQAASASGKSLSGLSAATFKTPLGTGRSMVVVQQQVTDPVQLSAAASAMAQRPEVAPETISLTLSEAKVDVELLALGDLRHVSMAEVNFGRQTERDIRVMGIAMTGDMAEIEIEAVVV